MTGETLHAPVVICPGCLTPMVAIESVPHALGLREVTYRCRKCNNETVRLQKAEK